MPCRLVKLSRVPEWKSVKATLLSLPVEDAKEEEEGDDEWNSKWKWVTDDENANSYQDASSADSDQLWLQQCLISISPAADVIAIAYVRKAVFLTSKWDVNEKSDLKMKFMISYKGSLMEDEKEKITSILCLPLASQKKSSEARPDWTCIIVGFSSGYIRIFTENCKLLLAQLLHEDSVIGIRCQTFQPSTRAVLGERHDELTIIYESAVVVVDGLSLIATLKACRNQLARSSGGVRVSMQPPPLTYKKWKLHCESLLDCENIGVVVPSSFDHMVTESMVKGPSAHPKVSPPVLTLLVGTGTNPYVGFYSALETNSQTLIGEAAMLVVNKMKSYLPLTATNLLGLNQQDKDQQPRIEPATHLVARHGLYDRRRQGNTIVMSPTRTLAAVTDDFGRVILIDLLKGTAIRFWKGYRDAQCAWIEVEEDVNENESSSSSKERRKALFLVIYAPRRGILEVWCAQQGPRVASFNVGKSCKLLYPGYIMMGLNRTLFYSCKQNFSKHCFLIDSEGLVRSLSVPFHCALSGKNGKGARDLHLLKEITSILKGPSNSNDELETEIMKHILGIRTARIGHQALSALIEAKHLSASVLENVAKALYSHLSEQGIDHLDSESRKLLQACCRLQQLLELYKSVKHVRKKAWDIADDDPNLQVMETKMNISTGEIARSLSFLALHSHMLGPKKKVTFMEDPHGCQPLSEFLSCFEIFQNNVVKTDEDPCIIEYLPITFPPSLPIERLTELGSFLFDVALQSDQALPYIEDAVRASLVKPEMMISSLFYGWTAEHKNFNHWRHWVNFHKLLSFLCSLEDPEVVSVSSDSLSAWWKNIRTSLSKATNITQAYSAAVIASSVANNLKSTPNKTSPSEEHCEDEAEEATDESKEFAKEPPVEEKKEKSFNNDWENITIEMEQWRKLMDYLEDIIVLSALIGSKQTPISRTPISLDSLLSGGPGFVSVIVAKWAINVGFKPDDLISVLDKSDDDETSSADLVEIGQDVANDGSSNDKTVESLLRNLRKRFPHSLEPDVLMANWCWEYMMLWNKEPETVKDLSKAIQCLRLVTNSVLKHGVACLMWKTFVLKRFEALAQLMEKVGKPPKERMCKRDLEISDIYLEDFLEFCCDLLKEILEANHMSEFELMPVFQPDKHWQGADVSYSAPLVLLAVSQKLSNRNFVQKHYELATALLLVLMFQLKNTRCMSLLYDMPVKVSFFKDLHHNIPNVTDSQTVQSNRLYFLMKVISAIVNTISDGPKYESKNQGESSAEGCQAQSTELREASRWFNRTLKLAQEWSVNTDDIRVHYVCCLYAAGHDSMGELAHRAVRNQQKLGSQLLIIAGQRALYALQNYGNIAQNLGTMPPNISNWLKTLDLSTLKHKNPPLEDTLQLLRVICSLLPEDQSEHKKASALHDAVESMNSFYGTK